MGIGLDLSRRFFETIVQPIVASAMPELRYAAARLGDGSEVLRFDTEMSADHNYGPTVQLFLSQSDFDGYAPQLMQALDRALPAEIDGWPIRFPNAIRPPAGTPGRFVPTMVSNSIRSTPGLPLSWALVPKHQSLRWIG